MRFEEDSGFIALHKEVNLDDILCMKEQRVVVHEHSDGRMSVFHGSDRLGIYDSEGVLLTRRCEEGKKRSGKIRRQRFTSASKGGARRS